MVLVGYLSFVLQKIMGAWGSAQKEVDVGELGLPNP